MLNIEKIHHVAIIVSDYEKSKKFYTEILGFKIIKETFRKERNSYKLDLEINGNYQIELFSFPNPPKRVNNRMGSIEKGKDADFTVFEEDILHTDLKTFSRLHADMTVVGGEIVYDVDRENFDEMVSLLMNMQM